MTNKSQAMKTKEPPLPKFDASPAERQAWHKQYLDWLTQLEPELAAEYGAAYAANCIEEHKVVANVFAMTPEELEKKHPANKERIRNLLGNDFELILPDGTKIAP
jgi:hypothetical protein